MFNLINIFMKKKIAMIVLSCMLFAGIGTSLYAGNGLQKVRQALATLIGGQDTPCWSMYTTSDNCNTHFILCGVCYTVKGIPDGPQGNC